MDRVKELWRRFQRTRLWHAWKRYGDARGNLLAGGVTYFAFFSVFPAVALAFTIFGVLLQDNPQWLEQIKDYLNDTLPGFIKDGDNGGLIPLETPSGNTLTVTGLIGLAGLLWAGLGWLGALRDGIRAIFGAEGAPGNFLMAKLRDLGVLVILGVAIVVSAAVTGVAGAATSWIAEAHRARRAGVAPQPHRVRRRRGARRGRRPRHAAAAVGGRRAVARPGRWRGRRRGRSHPAQGARHDPHRRHDLEPALHLDRPRRGSARLAQLHVARRAARCGVVGELPRARCRCRPHRGPARQAARRARAPRAGQRAAGGRAQPHDTPTGLSRRPPSGRTTGSTSPWARLSVPRSRPGSAWPARSCAASRRGADLRSVPSTVGAARCRASRQSGSGSSPASAHVVGQHAVGRPRRRPRERVGRGRRDPLRVQPELLEHRPGEPEPGGLAAPVACQSPPGRLASTSRTMASARSTVHVGWPQLVVDDGQRCRARPRAAPWSRRSSGRAAP